MQDRLYAAKETALLLCIFMVIRHYFFYSNIEYIYQEFGVEQNVISFSLIPVTTSFGIYLAFMASYNEIKNLHKKDDLKALIVSLKLLFLTIVINLDTGLENILNFKYDQVVNKPRFLILIPLLSMIATNAVIKKLSFRILLLLVCAILYNIHSSFILHYFIVFLAAQIIFIFLMKIDIFFGSNMSFIISLMCMCCACCYTLFFEISRIHIMLELLWGLAYFISILNIASILCRYSNLFGFRISVLSFYITQATCFTLFFSILHVINLDESLLNVIEIVLTFIILMLSLYVSRIIKIL